ncbi:adenylyltransferase/cytidyltransferase family protein [Candidatus Gracilibacteria bacterium]|nr:adenylyltransferase/cytidyltransferase family protein [Candidatus Gracilibacteria bacterium]
MQGNIVGVSVSGEVIHGKKLGRTLGVPTANIAFESKEVSPGVYACNIMVLGGIYFGVGTYQSEKKLFEVFIFDFTQDIYGKNIEIILLEKLRDNKKFENFEALKVQIHRDIKTSKELQFPVLTFGSFDILHEGHTYYLTQAKKYARSLITIIARDKTIEHIKGKTPYYHEKLRTEAIKELGISDIVELGDAHNPYVWFERYKPKIIALGYDQRGKFVEILPEKLKEAGLKDTRIIRIESLEPEKYKSSLLRGVLKKENP